MGVHEIFLGVSQRCVLTSPSSPSSSRFGKENFQQPTLLLPELENKISHFREKNIALEETLRNFKGIEHWWGWGDGAMSVGAQIAST